MELKVSTEIKLGNDKIRDSRQTNMSSEHYFLKWQTAEINFEKLLG